MDSNRSERMVRERKRKRKRPARRTPVCAAAPSGGRVSIHREM